MPRPPSLPFFFLIVPPPPRSTLFPYTTLFRSHLTGMRCYQMGKAVREVIDEYPDDLRVGVVASGGLWQDRKSTRLNSSHLVISYAVFCLKKKKQDQYRRVGESSPHDSRHHG